MPETLLRNCTSTYESLLVLFMLWPTAFPTDWLHCMTCVYYLLLVSTWLVPLELKINCVCQFWDSGLTANNNNIEVETAIMGCVTCSKQSSCIQANWELCQGSQPKRSFVKTWWKSYISRPLGLNLWKHIMYHMARNINGPNIRWIRLKTGKINVGRI